MNTTETIVALVTIPVLAFLIESLVEYLIGKPMEKSEKLAPYSWVLQYVAALAGIGLAWAYQTDLIAILTQGAPSTVGVVLTGLIIGRGSNFTHDIISKFSQKPV